MGQVRGSGMGRICRENKEGSHKGLKLAEIERKYNVVTTLWLELRSLFDICWAISFPTEVDKVTVMKLHCCETTAPHLFYTVTLDEWKESAVLLLIMAELTRWQGSYLDTLYCIYVSKHWYLCWHNTIILVFKKV